jgi:DNA-binding NarL/FixJ family response regulator
VLQLVAGGFTSQEIAARLNVAPGTVASYQRTALHTLGFPNRRLHAAAALKKWRDGFMQ